MPETGNATPETKTAAEPTATQATPTESEVQNKLTAGKFKTPEAAQKSLSEIEKAYAAKQAEFTRLSQELAELKKSKTSEPTAQPTATPASEPAKESATTETKAQQAQIAIMDEFIANGGKVSAETKAKISEMLGVPSAVAEQFEQYLAAQAKAGLERIQNNFKDLGQFDISEVIDEMSRTLPQDKLNALQTLIDSGDIEVMRPYIAAHVKAKVPQGQVGQAASGEGGFKDKAAMRAMMNSPKFGIDKAFTEEFWRLNEASPENVKLSR